ncbi:MAG: ATP-grasp domain-containing protein [Gammaproteobacteria bacterium]
MKPHITFVAPFFMDATLRFLHGAAAIEGVSLSLISQDGIEKVPAALRARINGHYQVANALDPAHLVYAARKLAEQFGPVHRLFGPLEQLQVPLAAARTQLGLDGVDVPTAMNFRDKSRMKDALRAANVPCARHALVGSADAAHRFIKKVGYPVVVKPPAGAGGKSTFRLDQSGDLQRYLTRFVPDPGAPALFEEFVRGTEYSFDSVMIDGELVWHSISRYMPSPLDVMENQWIQWTVMLARQIDGDEFAPICDAAVRGLRALGLKTGLSHMEWFSLPDGRIAISEVGARPPGAQFSSLLSYAHDLDFYKAWPRLMAFDEFAVPRRRYAVGAAYFRGQGTGRVHAVHGLDEAQRRYGELVVEVKLPREGQAPTDSYEGDGYVIVRHPETAAVEDALTNIVKLIRVELR